MGKRSTARKLAMQILYEAEVGGEEMEKAFDHVTSGEKYLEETKKFAKHLAGGTWKHKSEIDKIIEKRAVDWAFERIGKVDLSILRLALFELIYEKDTPSAVIVDEAVELAKKFSGEEASGFINGILGAYLKK
jgi:N utilization substance protein B